MFSNDPVQQVVEHLDFIANDKALFYNFIHKHPDFVRWCERIADAQFKNASRTVAPIPAFEDVTALETTVFDNWKANAKGPYQFGVTVKAYTATTIKNWKRPNWKASAKMWPAADAVKAAKKSKTVFSDNTMETIAGLSSPGVGYLGVFKHTIQGEGSIYNDEHVVFFNPDEGQCLIYTPLYKAWIAPFDGRDAKGGSLIGNAILQSRSANCETLAGWSTGSADPVA